MKKKMLNKKNEIINKESKQEKHPLSSQLLVAADTGRINILREALDAGVNVNTKFTTDFFNFDSNALHYASRSGHTDVVIELLNRGANVDCVDVEAWTPLHYACFNGHKNIAKILLDHGASKTIQNWNSRTPLDIAKYRQFHDIVQLLSDKIIPPENYARKQEDIDRKGKKHKVLQGIHFKNQHLFLGRYEIDATDVLRIELFRKNPQSSDITINAMDMLISCAVVFKFTHNYINFGNEVTALVEKRVNKKDVETTNANTENKKKRPLENSYEELEEQELPQQKNNKKKN